MAEQQLAGMRVDYRTEGRGDLLVPSANPAEGFHRFEIAAKEWVGLAVYRLTGRTETFLPGPRSAVPMRAP